MTKNTTTHSPDSQVLQVDSSLMMENPTDSTLDFQTKTRSEIPSDYLNSKLEKSGTMKNPTFSPSDYQTENPIISPPDFLDCLLETKNRSLPLKYPTTSSPDSQTKNHIVTPTPDFLACLLDTDRSLLTKYPTISSPDSQTKNPILTSDFLTCLLDKENTEDRSLPSKYPTTSSPDSQTSQLDRSLDSSASLLQSLKLDDQPDLVFPSLRLRPYNELLTSSPPLLSSSPLTTTTQLPWGGSVCLQEDPPMFRQKDHLVYKPEYLLKTRPAHDLKLRPSSQFNQLAVEAARHRTLASSSPRVGCRWSGRLPPRSVLSSFSFKMFVGGVPWDLSRQELLQVFSQFGSEVQIEGHVNRGFFYIVFGAEESVVDLLAFCHQGESRYTYYFPLPGTEVQVIPWHLADSQYCSTTNLPSSLDPKLTVFVGALHGMLTAKGLATVFEDLFGGVVYCRLDTDKNKYPIGSGKVTFNNYQSFIKAISAAFVEIRSDQFTKKVQVDPYLEDSPCSLCLTNQGPYFCRNLACFNYFCQTCWTLRHSQMKGGLEEKHRPLMRNSRGGHQWGEDPRGSLTVVLVRYSILCRLLL